MRANVISMTRTLAVSATFVITASVASTNASPQDAQMPSLHALGTWSGTSTCVGNRPACKNESVVYRIVAIDGEPSKVRLLADKVLDGKRVPMGKLDFDVSGDRLSCEFRAGSTQGVWELMVSGDTITGTLVVLPAREVARRVSVRRVSDDAVPTPPAIDEYGLVESETVIPAFRAELAVAPKSAQLSSSIVSSMIAPRR